MRRIVAAVDGSEAAYRAVEMAAQIGSKFGSQLTLLYVIEPAVVPPDLEEEDLPLLEHRKRLGEEVLTEARKRAERPGLRVDTRLGMGDPGELIAEAGADADVDLLVTGSRGLGRVARLLLGSVADRVAHLSAKPVLIVR